MIKAVLEEYIHEYQTIPVEKRPFNLFASNIADVFFPRSLNCLAVVVVLYCACEGSKHRFVPTGHGSRR